MKRLALMAAAAVAAISAPALAQTWDQARSHVRPAQKPINWVYSAQSEDGSSRWYYDSNSVTSDNSFRYFVLRMNEPNGYTSIYKAQVDCSDNSYRLLMGFTILPNGKTGESSSTATEWSYFVPSSNIGLVARGVCG